MNKYMEYVRNALDYRTRLEALAEEASELAQAALKLIRSLELSENTTPVSGNEAELNLMEEIQDVMSAVYLLGCEKIVDGIDEYYKWKRWAERLGYYPLEKKECANCKWFPGNFGTCKVTGMYSNPGVCCDYWKHEEENE